MFKTRTLIALGLVVVVGGLAVWKLTRKDPHVRSAGQAANAPIPALKKDDIDELHIAEPGKPEIVLAKQNAEWRLLQPIADRADQKNVEAAVQTLVDMKWKDVIAETSAVYAKLQVKDEEAVKITPMKGGKALTTLLVGKSANIRLDGDSRVWSVGNFKRYSLVRDAKLWRDREILHVAKDQIDSIKVAAAGAEVTAHREAGAPPPPPPPDPKADPKAPPPKPPVAADKWTITAGSEQVGGALDESVPTGIVNTLGHLDADDFAADGMTPEAAGLDQPRSKVTVTLADKSSKVLLVGKEEGNASYAQLEGGPRIWKIRKMDAERLVKAAPQWRDKTLSKLDMTQITKIDIAKGSAHTTLARADEKSWKGLAPADLGEIDTPKVTALTATFQNLKATGVAATTDPAVTGLAKPSAVITLTKKDNTTFTLTLGALKDGAYFVQATGRTDVLTMPEFTAKRLLKDPADFKKQAAAAPSASPVAPPRGPHRVPVAPVAPPAPPK